MPASTGGYWHLTVKAWRCCRIIVRRVTTQERRDVMTPSKTGWLFLGSVFVLALAGFTPAVYAHGGDSTLIHACVTKSSGEVKIVGVNASCKNNETAVDW